MTSTDATPVVTFPALGSTASVVVTDPAALGDAERLLRAEVAAIDAACSRFRDDSELSLLHATGVVDILAGRARCKRGES